MRYYVEAMKGLKVLVVDESPDIASLLSDIFEGQGAAVTVAQSPFEAMRRLLTARFDLVTVEIMRFGADRMKVLEFIRHCRRNLVPKTLVITAYRYDRQVLAVLNAMQVSYIFKPFAVEEVCDSSRQLLSCLGPLAAA
jgi:DNA-binding response OmpR family regulator